MNLSEFISFPRCHYVQRMYEQRLSDNLLEWILRPPRQFGLKRSLHCVMLQWFWANQDGTVQYPYKTLTCLLLCSSLCMQDFFPHCSTLCALFCSYQFVPMALFSLHALSNGDSLYLIQELGILTGKLELIGIFELPGHVSMIPAFSRRLTCCV